MATEPIGINTNNAVLSKQDGTWLITELPKKKDGEVKVYNLDKILESFQGVENISLSISGKSEIPPDQSY